MRKLKDKAATILFWGIALTFILLAVGILAFILQRGWSALSWEFLTEKPRNSMTAGGILTPIVGTVELVVLSMAFALPIGVATGLFFAEYAKPGPFVSALRTAIRCLAGVPSVVFGLFGLELFVILCHFVPSLLSASLTLACLSLPLLVTSSEQAFRAVPQDERLASYALGAGKWHTIWHVVFPSSVPSIITGAILALGRVAGETAPIIFTGAAFFVPHLTASLFDQVMALPYHVMVLATAGTDISGTRHIQYGTVVVLLVLVMSLCLTGILARNRLSRKRRRGA